MTNATQAATALQGDFNTIFGIVVPCAVAIIGLGIMRKLWRKA